MRILLDTGVLVRANAKAAGPARELLLAIVNGPHDLIASAFLLNEMERVLNGVDQFAPSAGCDRFLPQAPHHSVQRRRTSALPPR